MPQCQKADDCVPAKMPEGEERLPSKSSINSNLPKCFLSQDSCRFTFVDVRLLSIVRLVKHLCKVNGKSSQYIEAKAFALHLVC